MFQLKIESQRIHNLRKIGRWTANSEIIRLMCSLIFQIIYLSHVS